ncbi:hypothetical protein Tco_1437014 [Tanacetum coccineum]
MTESPLVDSSFVVLVFSPGDDPIACLNKVMAFLTVVASSSDCDEGIQLFGRKVFDQNVEKEKDSRVHKTKHFSHRTAIDFEKLNRLSDDFEKRFTPQQELSAEQAFWLRMSNPTSKPSDASPVKIEAPKVSLVNEILKKIKFHLAKFDNVVKIKDYT